VAVRAKCHGTGLKRKTHGFSLKGDRIKKKKKKKIEGE
jgi:hypothetical protein